MIAPGDDLEGLRGRDPLDELAGKGAQLDDRESARLVAGEMQLEVLRGELDGPFPGGVDLVEIGPLPEANITALG